MCKQYILNTRTMVYHTLDCHYDNMILTENYQIVDNIPANATPCSRCNPHTKLSLEEVLA